MTASRKALCVPFESDFLTMKNLVVIDHVLMDPC